ncbi:alpha/beta hydrolase [Elioraea tepida]|uniref:Alpha/beta hydrolase n=1 Tax=Elioraea tepida TaxID=2843330 RepID=A0A975U575_9PROT|nr:alpha/beta hydrolase [Elioraea tepida]QXM25789.1 alpha/beta hydrolase [Elioraea tepida]
MTQRTITTTDGVRLAVEDTGSGTAILFVHEFAGDMRSFEPQVRFFSRMYRCVTFNARGYPPSDVPPEPERYSQERARDDIRDVMDGLGIQGAHIVGVSMGGFAALHFGLAYPYRARSLVLGGVGYGAPAEKRAQFAEECEAAARRFETLPIAEAAASYGRGPTRVQFENKDPRGYAEFLSALAEHDPTGLANTLRGVQKRRPSIFDLAEELRALAVPSLIITGDEDDPCLETSLFMKRQIPSSGLVVLPCTGHTLNLEEPAAFNDALARFFAAVELGRWPRRDPRSTTGAILGAR